MQYTEPQRTGSLHEQAVLSRGAPRRAISLLRGARGAESGETDSLWELVSIEGRCLCFGYQAVLIFRLTSGDNYGILFAFLANKAARRRRATMQWGSLQK